MSIFKCHAMIEESKECGRSCWGKTIYCMWHNCWLTWYKLYLYLFPHRRSIGWAPYDRDFLKDMRPSPIISTQLSILNCFLACVCPIVFYLIGINKYYQSQFFLGIINICLWGVAFICILTMALGNKNLVFPKLLLVVSSLLVITQIYKIVIMSKSPSIAENTISLCGRLALLLWAVPIPRGPLSNTMVDVSDFEQFPPENIGAIILRGLGGVFFIIYTIGMQYI